MVGKKLVGVQFGEQSLVGGGNHPPRRMGRWHCLLPAKFFQKSSALPCHRVPDVKILVRWLRQQPKPAFRIFEDSPDVVVLESIGAGVESLELVAVKTAQPLWRADPDEAPTALVNGIDLPVGQSVFYCI